MDSQDICIKWMYGTQMNDKNEPYSVGGEEWANLFNKCYRVFKKRTLDHDNIYNDCMNHVNIHEKKLPSFFKNRATDIFEILLVHSSFINAYGMFHENLQIATNPRGLPTGYTRLIVAYTEFYKIIKNNFNRNLLELFTTPEQFKNLNDTNSSRPKNIMFSNTLTMQQIIDRYPVVKTVEKSMFANSVFPDFTNEMSSILNIITKKITFENTNRDSFRTEDDKITTGDIIMLKQAHILPSENNKPPIIIHKTPNTYLSQLFEKTCTILYKPFVITPYLDTEEHLVNVADVNHELSQFACRGYFNGNMGVFQTMLLSGRRDVNNEISSNMPVFFTMPNEAGVHIDIRINATREFLSYVLKDLKELGVFIPIPDTDRYELNKKFDIRKLESCKNLPDTLKEEVEDYFFLFIGNLLHLVVANNIPMPFKLSLAYITTFFKLNDGIDDKTLMSSIYLLEKPQKSAFIKILENPENLKNPEVIAVLDKDLKGSAMAKGVRMNKFTDPVYNKNPTILKKNIRTYLYELALNEYFLDKNIENMFLGFDTYKVFMKKDIYNMKVLNTSSYTLEQKLNIIPKVDTYLSGLNI